MVQKLLPIKRSINIMAPGALKQQPMNSSMGNLKLNLKFNKNDARTNLTSEDTVITHQVIF